MVKAVGDVKDAFISRGSGLLDLRTISSGCARMFLWSMPTGTSRPSSSFAKRTASSMSCWSASRTPT